MKRFIAVCMILSILFAAFPSLSFALDESDKNILAQVSAPNGWSDMFSPCGQRLDDSPRRDEDLDLLLFFLSNYLTQAAKEQQEINRRAAALYAQARREEDARVDAEIKRLENALCNGMRSIVCSQCNRTVSAAGNYCMYCGHKLPTLDDYWGSWSAWSHTPIPCSSTREVETQTVVVGFNMFHYRTQFRDEPYYRVFRNFSVNGDYDALYSRYSYGEKYVERVVTFSELEDATVVSPDSWNIYPGKGYQDGVTTAYDFHDDEFLWFISNAILETQYRYRDLITHS